MPVDKFGLPVTPYGSATGTYGIEWSYADGPQSIPRTVIHGRVTYAVDRRFRGKTDEYNWLRADLNQMPSWVVKQLHRDIINPGLGLQARLVSAQISMTTSQTCDNGAPAQTVTTVQRIVQSHASLLSKVPTLNLLARRGTADIDLAWTVLRDGIVRLDQAVYGTGDVSVTTTGTDCSGSDDTGSIPATVNRTEQSSIARFLADGGGLGAAVDSWHELPVTVTRAGGTALVGTYRLADFSRHQDGESFRGSIHPDLHFGGPPIAQQALCLFPERQVERARSLSAARAVLRRGGFPRVVFGGNRRYSFRRPTFYLQSGSPEAFCGVTLGSRRYPVLYRDPGGRP